MELKLLEQTKERVLIEVSFDPENPQLDAARNPGFTGQETLIAASRGDVREYRIFYQDGSTMTFHDGMYGATMISRGVNQLKKKIISFLASYGINLNLQSTNTSIGIKYMYFPHDKGDQPHPTHLGARFLYAYTREELKEIFPKLEHLYTTDTTPTGAIVEYYTFEPKSI